MVIKKFYRINQAIRSRTVRIVGSDFNEELSLEDALRRARQESKDLVEVSPNSTPPVVRIIDFKKFLFEEKKKEKKVEKVKSVLKELRFSPVIAENDLKIRVERAKEFLSEGNQVKISIHFRGREITHPEIGTAKLALITTMLAQNGKASSDPRWTGPMLSVMFTPVK